MNLLSFIGGTTHHHHHHNLPELSEPLRAVLTALAETIKGIQMISSEIQGLMDQAKKFTDIAPALDAGFKALTLQVAELQRQVASLTSDGVITAAEKAQIVQTTNDLAASFSTLQADIPAGTPAAPTPVADKPADAPADAPVDPTNASAN